MGDPELKDKKRKRMARKRKEKILKIRSKIAKSLEDPINRQRVVEDKHGKKHDLEKLSHAKLVQLIQDEDAQEFLGG